MCFFSSLFVFCYYSLHIFLSFFLLLFDNLHFTSFSAIYIISWSLRIDHFSQWRFNSSTLFFYSIGSEKRAFFHNFDLSQFDGRMHHWASVSFFDSIATAFGIFMINVHIWHIQSINDRCVEPKLTCTNGNFFQRLHE